MRSTSSERAVRKITGTSERRRRSTADVEAAHVRQADVEHDQVVPAGIQTCQRIRPQGAALAGKAVGLQGISQGIGNRWLVVDDEDFHGDDGSAFRAARRHPRTAATCRQQGAASAASGCGAAKRRTMALPAR
jgi:hypothetical protein